jgi:hypothetical protein
MVQSTENLSEKLFVESKNSTDASSLYANEVLNYGSCTALAEEHLLLGNYDDAKKLAEEAIKIGEHTYVYFKYELK